MYISSPATMAVPGESENVSLTTVLFACLTIVTVDDVVRAEPVLSVLNIGFTPNHVHLEATPSGFVMVQEAPVVSGLWRASTVSVSPADTICC